MKFLDNIGTYSFGTTFLGLVLFFSTFSSSGGEVINYIWPLFLVTLAGGIIGLVRHRSLRDTIFGLLTVLLFVALLLLIIGAAASFRD